MFLSFWDLWWTLDFCRCIMKCAILCLICMKKNYWSCKLDCKMYSIVFSEAFQWLTTHRFLKKAWPNYWIGECLNTWKKVIKRFWQNRLFPYECGDISAWFCLWIRIPSKSQNLFSAFVLDQFPGSWTIKKNLGILQPRAHFNWIEPSFWRSICF